MYIVCGPTGGCSSDQDDLGVCIPAEGAECEQLTPVVDHALACYDYKWSPADIQAAVGFYAALGVWTAETDACFYVYSQLPFC
jgi:hypothetical protein